MNSEHLPCFPDLAPPDFCLSPKLKLFLAGQRFSSNQEAIAAVEGYFADLLIYFLTAIGLSSGGSTHLHTNST
jgi:hypothetical protein